MSPPRLEFSISKSAIRGARPYQEDFCEVWRAPDGSSLQARPLLAVLADGMGGHVSGEKASRFATEGFIRNFSSEAGSIEQLLDHSLVASSDALNSAILADKALAGMGCTLVAAYVDQEGLRWVSVGDSALMLYRPGTHTGDLQRLNADHSLGALLDTYAANNRISLEEARNNPRRRTLRSALTGAPITLKDIEAKPVPLRHGDWVLLASDGLETLQGNDIARLIKLNQDRAPDHLVRDLLAEVERRKADHQDNTTVVAIRVVDPMLLTTEIVDRKTASPAVAHPLLGNATRPAPPMAGVANADIALASNAARDGSFSRERIGLVSIGAIIVALFGFWLLSGNSGGGTKDRPSGNTHSPTKVQEQQSGANGSPSGASNGQAAATPTPSPGSVSEDGKQNGGLGTAPAAKSSGANENVPGKLQ